MDIKEITEIVNDKFADDKIKRLRIIHSLANDESALTDVLEILNRERAIKKELITDMNHELGRAHIFIESFMPPVPKLKKGEKEHGFSKSFVLEKIEEFYHKYKPMITHCFNKFN